MVKANATKRDWTNLAHIRAEYINPKRRRGAIRAEQVIYTAAPERRIYRISSALATLSSGEEALAAAGKVAILTMAACARATGAPRDRYVYYSCCAYMRALAVDVGAGDNVITHTLHTIRSGAAATTTSSADVYADIYSTHGADVIHAAYLALADYIGVPMLWCDISAAAAAAARKYWRVNIVKISQDLDIDDPATIAAADASAARRADLGAPEDEAARVCALIDMLCDDTPRGIRNRDALTMLYNGASIADIAAHQGITPASMYARLDTIRRRAARINAINIGQRRI